MASVEHRRRGLHVGATEYGSAMEAAATPIQPADTRKADAEIRWLREAS